MWHFKISLSLSLGRINLGFSLVFGLLKYRQAQKVLKSSPATVMGRWRVRICVRVGEGRISVQCIGLVVERWRVRIGLGLPCGIQEAGASPRAPDGGGRGSRGGGRSRSGWGRASRRRRRRRRQRHRAALPAWTALGLTIFSKQASKQQQQQLCLIFGRARPLPTEKFQAPFMPSPLPAGRADPMAL